VCTMAKDQSLTHLESLMRECGSMEDQKVSHSCSTDWDSFKRFYRSHECRCFELQCMGITHCIIKLYEGLVILHNYIIAFRRTSGVEIYWRNWRVSC
jgi:hypothetical protein